MHDFLNLYTIFAFVKTQECSGKMTVGMSCMQGLVIGNL